MDSGDNGGGLEQGVGTLLIMFSSSAWMVRGEGRSPMRCARVIASLKEGKGPVPKEEVSGSSTAMRCWSPCGVIVAMEWAVLGMAEAVLTKCTLPHCAFPLPLPLPHVLRFPFFFEPEAELPE